MQWQIVSPQVVVVDNFLTEAALAALRRFCWGSTIWQKAYDDGYLGAFPETGFACPLLAQIAEELREGCRPHLTTSVRVRGCFTWAAGSPPNRHGICRDLGL
jgi:hypothetical protein